MLLLCMYVVIYIEKYKSGHMSKYEIVVCTINNKIFFAVCDISRSLY